MTLQVIPVYLFIYVHACVCANMCVCMCVCVTIKKEAINLRVGRTQEGVGGRKATRESDELH